MACHVLIAHAPGEESIAEQLASPIREAGYRVSHRGTVLVGESITEEASKVLSTNGPVILCGTVKALGTVWAHRIINAAQQHGNHRIFPVQVEEDAYLGMLSIDARPARFWLDPSRAIHELLESLQLYYPNVDHEETALSISMTWDNYKKSVSDKHQWVRLAVIAGSKQKQMT